MAHIPTEVENAFFAGNRDRSFGFAINDSVRLLTGAQAGAVGSVIAIRAIAPDLTLFIELSDGSEIVVLAKDIERLQ